MIIETKSGGFIEDFGHYLPLISGKSALVDVAGWGLDGDDMRA